LCATDACEAAEKVLSNRHPVMKLRIIDPENAHAKHDHDHVIQVYSHIFNEEEEQIVVMTP
jgi:hypothetical protein